MVLFYEAGPPSLILAHRLSLGTAFLGPALVCRGNGSCCEKRSAKPFRSERFFQRKTARRDRFVPVPSRRIRPGESEASEGRTTEVALEGADTLSLELCCGREQEKGEQEGREE